MLRTNIFLAPARGAVTAGITARGSDPGVQMCFTLRWDCRNTFDPVVKRICLGGKILNGDRNCYKAYTALICGE